MTGNQVKKPVRLENGIVECPFEEGDDLMTLKEFRENIECGGFTDYDGFGVFATISRKSNLFTCPTQFKRNKCIISFFGEEEVDIPDWATHIVWYNR